MAHLLTNLGEEWIVLTGAGTATLKVGVYNDASGAATGGDAIDDASDVAALTTRPNNSADYAEQSAGFTAASLGGNWGIDNDAEVTFTFTDVTTSQMVDSWYLLANFTPTGGTLGDHLIATGALSQARDIGSIDTLNISPGGVGFTVT